jgi:hypothetical protein
MSELVLEELTEESPQDFIDEQGGDSIEREHAPLSCVAYDRDSSKWGWQTSEWFEAWLKLAKKEI